MNAEAGDPGGAAQKGQPGRRRRRLLGVALVLVVAGVLYACRNPLLRAAGKFLIAEDPGAATEFVLVVNGDRCLDEAARLHHGPTAPGVLLFDPVPGRLEELGILEPYTATARRELAARGVSELAVTVLRPEVMTDWDRARRLRAWLQGHPGARVTLLCARFGSRRKERILERVLGVDRQRVLLHALRDRTYDENDWWRRKEGVLDVFNGYLGLGFVWVRGEEAPERETWDPDTYEKTLR